MFLELILEQKICNFSILGDKILYLLVLSAHFEILYYSKELFMKIFVDWYWGILQEVW